MASPRVACFFLLSILLGLPSHRACAGDPPAARIQSVIVVPGEINDEGNGVDVEVQIVFVDPARDDGGVAVKIIPEGGNEKGRAQWSNEKKTLHKTFRQGASHVSVKDNIKVLRKGTVVIKAVIPNDSGNNNTYVLTVRRNSQ